MNKFQLVSVMLFSFTFLDASFTSTNTTGGGHGAHQTRPLGQNRPSIPGHVRYNQDRTSTAVVTISGVNTGPKSQLERRLTPKSHHGRSTNQTLRREGQLKQGPK